MMAKPSPGITGSMKKLTEFGIDTVNKRAVSMHSGKVLRPAWDGYAGCLCGRPRDEKTAARSIARIAVDRDVGLEESGRITGVKTFTASAPLKELLRKFRFEPELVTEVAKELLGKGKS